MSAFFETSNLSEEELREKQASLSARLYSAHAMGMSYELRAQLEAMIGQIEEELRMRWSADMAKQWDAMFPDVIESEPDLKPGAKEPTKKEKVVKTESSDSPKIPPRFNKVYKK